MEISLIKVEVGGSLIALSKSASIYGKASRKASLINSSNNAALITNSEGAELVKVFLVGGSGGGGGDISQWIVVSANTQLIANTGFLCVNDLTLIDLQLPAIAGEGQIIAVSNKGVGTVRISQGAGQRIRIGDKATTIGVQGNVKLNTVGDFLRLIYLGGDWVGVAIIGNLEVN
jgi:hypothetical protein